MYNVIVPPDSAATLTEENQKWALKNMEEVTKVQIAASGDIGKNALEIIVERIPRAKNLSCLRLSK